MKGNFTVPSINVSGNLGARAKSRPPKPHPISAISTFFVTSLSFRCSSTLTSCDSLAVSPSVGCF